MGCCICVHDGRSMLSLEGVMWLLHDGKSMLSLSGCSCFIVFYAKLLLLLICVYFFSLCIPYPAQGHINPMLKLAKLLISVTLRCSTFSISYPSYSSHQWCWSSSVMAILWRILHSIFFGFEFNNFHRIEWRMFWNLCFSTLFDWFLNDKICLILFHWHGW